MALGIAGLRVGMWTQQDGRTGCTVVLSPPGTVGALAVRGAAPGTREAAALGAAGKITTCHAVVLSGGSAFGLATADGVMRWLEERGIGHPTAVGVVPIVGAAILLDATAGDPALRPGADQGYAACEAASDDEPPEGAVGAGAGASVAKVAGIEHAWRGGQGTAIRREGELVVAALVVNNAVGEVVGDDGHFVAASRAPSDAPRYPRDAAPFEARAGDVAATGDGPAGNTVIGCVVTNAALDKPATHRTADLATAGIARAVRPAHTSFDGDALFCLATGAIAANVDLVSALAVEAVAEATRRGPANARSRRAADGPDRLPGLADPPR